MKKLKVGILGGTGQTRLCLGVVGCRKMLNKKNRLGRIQSLRNLDISNRLRDNFYYSTNGGSP